MSHTLNVSLGDDIAATNAHFRVSMAEADFAAVRRNHSIRAELSDSERVGGQADRQLAAEGRGGAVGIVARTE